MVSAFWPLLASDCRSALAALPDLSLAAFFTSAASDSVTK